MAEIVSWKSIIKPFMGSLARYWEDIRTAKDKEKNELSS
jgi:hypothetical protein